MGGQRSKSARIVAVEVLNQCDPLKKYAGSILDKLLHKTDQKQRITDLVFGTLRNRLAIDRVIESFSGRPIARIQKNLLNIIRIGTYELIYSPSTEEYAIVNEAVESAKAIAGKKQCAFVNAVLRQIIRHMSNRRVRLAKAEARRTLPHTHSRGCEFDIDFLPSDEASVAEYLSTVFSLPEWLVREWLDEFGEESTRQICFASNRRPSFYIRPNILKTTAEALAEKIGLADIDFEIVPEVTMIRIKSPRAVTQLPGFMEGLFVVQDITASQAVRILNPRPEWIILDLCAAPGVKTTQLAEATGDSAKIVATDIDAGRLEMVKENINRLGIQSVKIAEYASLQIIADDIGPFEAVLLDVPCSNTGVLAKRIEARYRVNPNSIKALTRVQSELLATASVMLKPRGKICYSTCSIQKGENHRLIRDFLKKNKIFELESERLILPSAGGFDHDGGYTAILVKKG